MEVDEHLSAVNNALQPTNATDNNDFMNNVIQSLQLEAPPAWVYHYTSMEVLLKLLQNTVTPADAQSIGDSLMQFHISSAFCMNDILEYTGLHSNNLWGISNVNLGIAQWSMGLPYIMSLSAKYDSIPMWQNYGDSGKGVCLCFDTDKLRNALNALKENSDIFCHTALYMCKYYDKDDKAQLFPNFSSKDAGDQQREAIRRIVTMSFYKNKDWEYEVECRLMMWKSLNVEHKMRGKELVSYAPLQIPISCLRTITVGPCVSDRTYECLIQMIEQRYKGTSSPTVNKSESTLSNN